MDLLKFRLETLVGCIILFLIQGVPMFHTFDGPCCMKNEKCMQKRDCNHIFHVFLIFRVAGPIENMQHGYFLDEESNYASNDYSHSKFD